MVWLQISSTNLASFVTAFTSKPKSGQKHPAHRFSIALAQG